jgi:uncharacterized C2H2 Zn-finger protein
MESNKLYQCPHCDYLFKDGAELFNHIENKHFQLPISEDKKCPDCGSVNVTFQAVGENRIASLKTGKMEVIDEYFMYYCEDCRCLFKIKKI